MNLDSFDGPVQQATTSYLHCQVLAHVIKHLDKEEPDTITAGLNKEPKMQPFKTTWWKEQYMQWIIRRSVFQKGPSDCEGLVSASS